MIDHRSRIMLQKTKVKDIEKEQLLQTIGKSLRDNEVTIEKGDDEQNTLIFRFNGERIGLNQLDLIQLFTVVRYIHFREQTVYTTIKQGFGTAAKVLLR